ncbi:Ankyrin repeats (3 copies) [Phytophthora infestans]|uniref:Ankyrin repeats (3 copies) n=1 Tax=Phytophthora infestans TaxID=4787 RepID=A0A833SNS4_PHYIN|nr:Ankyrin repeats (3 copies) [Phytophthora infestans]
MAHVDNQRAQEGVIRSHIDLAEAAANGSRGMVDFLLDNGMQIDTPGKDGTTPLCAAALWGNDAMVAFLLDKGADVSARNEGTGWTALHAASFQEHGKVVRILLAHKADPKMVDVEGRRAVDYASISEAIWPFFAAQGHTKSLKSDLVAKGIIRKIQEQPEEVQLSDKHESISSFSRPGSAYIRAQMYPPHARRQSPAIKSRDGRILTGPIDPLGDMPSELESNQRGPSLKRLGI